MGKGASGLYGNTYGAKIRAVLAQNNAGGDKSDATVSAGKTPALTPKKKLYSRETIDSIMAVRSSATWHSDIDAKGNQVLLFDGQKLSLFENGKLTMLWDGISGKEGYQTKEYQHVAKAGPLPEGTYVARRERYQEISNISDKERFKGNFGGGPWPGNEKSWGEQRVWLDASKETDMKGRGGFSIHGGAVPGSAGCIDLTKDMPAFAQWYKNNGKDVVVVVKYPD